MERQKRFSECKPDRRAFRQKLRRALKSTATSEFGSISGDHDTLLCYEKQVSNWFLVTSFEIGRREQLRYHHGFHALRGGSLATHLPGGISLLNWTGIFPDTSWSWLLSEEIAETVEAVRNLCIYFLERAGELIAGISNPLLF
jgi:hypothetical protein